MKLGSKSQKSSRRLFEVLIIVSVISLSTALNAQSIIKIWDSNPWQRNSPPSYTMQPVQHTFNGFTFTHILVGSFSSNAVVNGLKHVDIDLLDGYTGNILWKSRHSGFEEVVKMSMTDDNNNDGIKDVHVWLKGQPAQNDHLKLLNGITGQEISRIILNRNGTPETNPETYVEVDINNDGKKEIIVINGGRVSGYFIQ